MKPTHQFADINKMKYFLNILFILVVIGLIVGFVIQNTNESQGNFIIGISVLTGFFILMPVFIYHRWKDKKVEDYLLNRKNIYKMRDYQHQKEIEKREKKKNKYN